jgi:adenine-specific DNA methylase
VVDQLAHVQEQLKQLQDTIEAMHSEQHLMNVSVESGARLAAQNSLELDEVIHTLSENKKIIDLLDRQLQVANNWGDHNATGVGILLERANELASDLQQIKTKLGLY